MTSETRILMVHYLHDTQSHFLDQTNISRMGYEELLNSFRGFKTLRSHGLTAGFADLGWNVMEVFGDFQELQTRWAQEHDCELENSHWKDQALMAQLDHFRPEIVFCDDVSRLPQAFLNDRPSFVRVFAAYQGFPMNFDRLRAADVVYTCTPSIQLAFNDCGFNTELVNHSFDPGILNTLPKQTEKHGFIFSGHSGYGYDWHHRTRYKLLHWLLTHSPIEAWLVERDLTLFPDIEDPLRDLFPHNTHPPVYGKDMYALMRSSKVVLNIHADAAYGHSGNMRMFEATGAGACMLTEHSLNVGDLFEPDVEVVTYRSPEECLEKALYLLGNDDVRREIGRKAQERTFKEHLADHRTRQMFDSINALL